MGRGAWQATVHGVAKSQTSPLALLVPPFKSPLFIEVPLFAAGKEDLLWAGLSSPHPHPPREAQSRKASDVRASEVQWCPAEKTAMPGPPHQGARAPGQPGRQATPCPFLEGKCQGLHGAP